MGDLLMGIDVGTYSSKGVLVDLDGTVQKSVTIEHKMDIPRPGWAEQDADGIWWADTVELCRSLLNGDPYRGDDVAALGVSAIGPCMLPLDKECRPLRPGILYGVDARATQEIQILNARLGTKTILEFSGMALSSQAVGPKILWFRNNEPDLWDQTSMITTASSYLVFRLTGKHVMDRHTASHYMPLMDIQTLEWSGRFASEIVSLRKLPCLGWSDELAGGVTQTTAEETGLQAGTPVAVGAVDALSEAISVGVSRPGDLMIMYGSTAFFILVLDEPVPDERVWTVAGAFRPQYNLAAGMATTGSLTRWFRDQLAKDLVEDQAYAQLFHRVQKVPAGSGGLLVLPYFSGERTPINDPEARGVIAGLTLAHTRDHLFRAILEGVAYGIRHNFETFQKIGASIERIVAVGGGAQSEDWLQIVSDVAGVSQVVPSITIGASYGDAFLAGLAAGLVSRDDMDTWVKTERVVSPRPETRKVYEALYQDYLGLYQETKSIVHRLGGV